MRAGILIVVLIVLIAAAVLVLRTLTKGPLAFAGGPAVTPVSPMPPGSSPLLMTCTSMFGTWSMRSMR